MALSLRWGLTQSLVRDYARLVAARSASAAAVEPAKAKEASMWDEFGTVAVPSFPYTPMPKDFKEHPDRDLKNFPHPEVPLWPSKTRFAFIPDSWFQFFYPKTGATGGYVFGAGLLTFLFSKEWVVVTAEMREFPSFLAVVYLINRLGGHKIQEFFHGEKHAELAADEKWRSEAQDNLRFVVSEETGHQAALAETAPLLAAVKKENVAFQQEAEYRHRLKTVHDDVKRRLDFMLETEAAKRRMLHKHMVDWVVAGVKASITPDKEKAFLQQCISDLHLLAKKTSPA